MHRSSIRATGVNTVPGLLLSGAGVPGQDGHAPSFKPLARWTFDSPPALAEVALNKRSGRTPDAGRGRRTT